MKSSSKMASGKTVCEAIFCHQKLMEISAFYLLKLITQECDILTPALLSCPLFQENNKKHCKPHAIHGQLPTPHSMENPNHAFIWTFLYFQTPLSLLPPPPPCVFIDFILREIDILRW